MSSGDSFTLVLSEKHQVFSFGKASHGRLGLGPNSSALSNESSQDFNDCVSEPTLI